MEEKLRQKYIEAQSIDKQAQQIQEQLSQVNQQIENLNSVIESLEELKTIKEGDELLVPITNGIFFEAIAKKTENVKINVGSETVLEKGIDDAKKMLKKQEDELNEIRERLNEFSQELAIKSERVHKEAQEALKEYENV
ncbi:MAG: prefoldin subunit alpha [Candidatus Woesearchaeota archaeon]